MKGFFSNLVDRHLGTCETIQPRSSGRFETGQNSFIGADNFDTEETGHDQVQPTYDESAITDSPAITDVKPATVESNDDFSSLSSAEKKQTNTSTRPTFTDHNLANIDSPIPSSLSQATQLQNNDAPLKSENMKPTIVDRPTLSADEKTINTRTKNNSDTLNNVISNNHPLAKTVDSRKIPESELNHRIQAMIQHLTKDRSSAETSGSQNEQGKKKNNNQNLMTALPHAEVASIASPVPSAVTKNKSIQGKNPFSKNKNRASDPGQLEPPSWLTDLTTQLTQRLQDVEQKTDPVINVTIGRVEVRAVQTETPKITRQTKKPTGVMTLDDYLKRREGRRTK